MTPFLEHQGRVVALLRHHVDTDQIIPKQFLKRIERTGFGQFLFYNWRFDAAGAINPDFVLNRPEHQGATILVAGENFGCGSSREHAPWALKDYGFQVLVAPSFADIFYNNCIQNGILPVTLSREDVETLVKLAESSMHLTLRVSLADQTMESLDGRFRVHFAIDPRRKETLMKGLDPIGETLLRNQAIQDFEQRHVLSSVPGRG